MLETTCARQMLLIDELDAVSQCFQDPFDSVSSGFNIVLPNPNNANAVASQQTANGPIAFPVPADLHRPETRVLARGSETLRTAVPKTSVNENSDPALTKIEVGFSDNLGRMQGPAAKSSTS